LRVRRPDWQRREHDHLVEVLVLMKLQALASAEDHALSLAGEFGRLDHLRDEPSAGGPFLRIGCGSVGALPGAVPCCVPSCPEGLRHHVLLELPPPLRGSDNGLRYVVMAVAMDCGLI